MRTTLLLVLSVCLLACSGDDDPPACAARMEPDGGADPMELCEDLLSAICDREVECRDDAPTHADCVDIQRDAIDCGGIMGVSESYDRCIDDIGGQTCGAWTADTRLPASCAGSLTSCAAE